ncbi:MAG: prephenate dehydratase, partial [Deltaproteobacteria bacterium]|nr:prephenate dehydratase [Deltaproteobacteria bacterium]
MDEHLNEIRKKIDLVDYEIMKLLNQRMELSMRSRKLKRKITDPDREEEVFANVMRFSRPLVTAEFSQKLYREIIDESRHIQDKPFKTIGFQGEHGAYSEVAALNHDPSLISIPCVEFAEVFEAIADKELDFGIVPVENSLEGAITPVIDLLLETDLKIVGEISLPICHCLLTLPETNHYDIRIVASHPQALAQCRNFITKHKLQTHPFYDTAGA